MENRHVIHNIINIIMINLTFEGDKNSQSLAKKYDVLRIQIQIYVNFSIQIFISIGSCDFPYKL